MSLNSENGRFVKLAPEKSLSFRWDSSSSVPTEFLSISDVSSADDKYVIFKVKTTAPKRYVVRPPQGYIRPGQSAEIKLNMVNLDAASLWKEAAEATGTNKAMLASEDKFLVQTAVVDRAFVVSELDGKDEKAVSAALQVHWKKLAENDKKGAQKKIKSSKLTTKFAFSADVAAAGDGPTFLIPAASSSPGSAAPVAAALPALPQQHAAEEPSALELRNSYDDMVKYVVVLTGERDLLQQENTALVKARDAAEDARQTAEEKLAKSVAGGVADASSVTVAAKDAGFAFVHVLVVGLVAFVLGRIVT